MELDNTNKNNKNNNQNIQNLKNNYLNSKIEYLDALKNDPQYKRVFETIKGKNTDCEFLWYEVFSRLIDIEDGKVKKEDLIKKENEISIIMASIENWMLKKQKEVPEKKDIEDIEK